MRWPWSKQPTALKLPQPEYAPVRENPLPKPASHIVVEEHDTSNVDIQELQTRTGIQRVFDRVTGKFK